MELGELQEYIDLVNESIGKYNLKLNNMSIKARITRYQALEKQIDAILQRLYALEYEYKGNELLKEVYTDAYYRTWYNIDQYYGFHQEFARVNPRTIDELIKYPFNGANFSGRIWRQKDHMLQVLTEDITTMLVQGKNPQTLARDFAKRFNTKEYEAYRLLYTESSFIIEQGTLAAYKEDSVEKYQILATLDMKTSDICREQDGEIYDVDKATVGVNYPPFHPFCRTTTVPYYEDVEDEGTRAARGADGKTYYVPSNMKYADWKKTFVDGGSKKGLSQIDRTRIIDTIMNSNAISKFDDVHKALIKADLEKANDMNLRIVQQSIDNLHLNTNGTGVCFYRPGSGYLEMNMNKEPVENIRTFWHEYGHYIDDVRYGNGMKLSTIIGDDKYSFEALGVSSRADLLHKYDSKVGSDIQGFLDEIAPGKYEVRGDNYVNIYLKGTDIQVGEQWGTNFKDFSTLMDEINEGLKDKLGAYDSEKYLRSLGKPQMPEWSDYFIQYRTPKRQTLKTKPAFKGAEEAWHDAVQKYSEELALWEKANPNAYAEASKLYDAYLDRKERFGAIADLIDGETRGELGMRVLWGGHDSAYYKNNDRHINEGWANWFQLTFQNDVEMLEYLEHYAPEAKRIFEECYEEMVKQTFGG